MALDDTLILYQYINVQFNRLNPSAELWFAPQAVANIEPILDAQTFYVDMGGINIPAWMISGSFENETQRDLLLSKIRTTGTLQKVGKGLSRTVLLFTAVPTFVMPGLWTADMTFTPV